MAPISPTTEMKRRNTPLAVMPPITGRLVTNPDTFAEKKGDFHFEAIRIKNLFLTIYSNAHHDQRHNKVNNIQP